jgi:nucleoside-diphosphate-sugar epimerase
MRCLVVGGTGPTGPYIVRGLLAGGHDVTILHRGTHESDLIPESVRHIHTDVRSGDSVRAALEGEAFDVAVITYGRLREIVAALVGAVGRVVTVGGFPAYEGYWDASMFTPPGLPVPTREDARKVAGGAARKAALVLETEQAVFDAFPNATHLRYPILYGPNQPVPREWCVVRRILDGRPHIILPDGGLTLNTYGYVENVAHAVLLAVEHAARAAGQIYNVADEQCLTVRQVVDVIAAALEHEWEVVELPREYAVAARPLLMGPNTTHRMISVEAIRNDLGYRDVVTPVDALAVTARWYRDHPCAPGGIEEIVMQDPFDYEAEDRMIAAWREAEAILRAVPPPSTPPGNTLAYDPA